MHVSDFANLPKVLAFSPSFSLPLGLYVRSYAVLSETLMIISSLSIALLALLQLWLLQYLAKLLPLIIA